MDSSNFGVHLLNNEVINHQQLIDAIEFLGQNRKSISSIALASGLLTPENIKEIKDISDEETNFVDIALGFGFINETQKVELVEEEQNSTIYFGDALVSLGIINKDKMEEELLEFMIVNQPDAFSDTESSHKESTVEILIDVSNRCLKQFAHLQPKSSEIIKGTIPFENDYTGVEVSIFGDFTAQLIMVVPKPLVKEIAKNNLMEEDPDPDDPMAKDVVREILSIISGNLASELSYANIVTEISLPVLNEDIKKTLNNIRPESEVINININCGIESIWFLTIQ